jgi:hypothetical protein
LCFHKLLQFSANYVNFYDCAFPSPCDPTVLYREVLTHIQANKLPGAVSAAEYKYPVLGLVFLKYVSDLFDSQGSVIRKRLAEQGSLQETDYSVR